MQFLQRASAQFNQLWQGMSLGRKIGVIALSLIGAAAIVGVAYWAAQPDYRILFTNLAPDDAGAITAKLQAKNIPFRLDANGTTVLVPADHVQQARVDLAMEGLPAHGEKGWGLFDENSLGMTPAQEHVKYGRALQAEIAKTIMQLQPVAHARVHIARPEPTPFVRDRKPTTASVVLKLKPGATLPRQSVAGIVALVARSVDGLAAENVTVLDNHGRILSERSNPESGVAGASHLEYKRELEAYLSGRAEELLEQYLGPGRAVVRVTADIDMQRVIQTQTTYDAEGKVPATEEITSSKHSGTTAAGGGPAGTSSNVRNPPGGGTKGEKREEETTRTAYLVPKTTREIQKLAGSVERLTVAAMVDLTPREGSDAPALPVAAIENIVKRAVGFNADRRDEITVTNAKLTGALPPTEPDGEGAAAQTWQSYLHLARHASVGTAAVVVLLLGWLILRKFQPTSAPATNEQTAPAAADPLSQLAERDPDAIARLLKSWIEEQATPRKAAA